MSWRERHPILAVLLGGFLALIALSALMNLLNGRASFGGLVAVLLFGFLAWRVFGSPGRRAEPEPVHYVEVRQAPAPRRQRQRPDRAAPAPNPVVFAPAAPLPSPPAQGFDALPTATRVALMNWFDLDETPLLALTGANGAMLVGTDRRVIVVPEGRDRNERIVVESYSRLANVRLDTAGRGAWLVLLSIEPSHAIPPIYLADEAAMSHAVTVTQQLRAQITAARGATV